MDSQDRPDLTPFFSANSPFKGIEQGFMLHRLDVQNAVRRGVHHLNLLYKGALPHRGYHKWGLSLCHSRTPH